MVTGLPSNYIFLLLPCYEADCPHPECAKGKPADEQTCIQEVLDYSCYQYLFKTQKGPGVLRNAPNVMVSAVDIILNPRHISDG